MYRIVLVITIFVTAVMEPVTSAQSLAPQQIISSLTSMCLQPKDGSATQGTPIVQEVCAPIAAQEWLLVGIGNGHFHLKNAQKTYCMDAFGAAAPKTPVELWPCAVPTITNETWDLGDPKGGRLLSRIGGSSFCLEVAGGVTSAGQYTQIYGCNGTTSQVWRLQPSTFSVVPNVDLQLEAHAISTLALYGFGYIENDQGRCSNIGVVTGQDPGWGKILPAGTKINIFYNSGSQCKK
jgi:hypothetical protein